MKTLVIGEILESYIGRDRFRSIAMAAGTLTDVDGISLNHDETDPLVQATLRACEEQGLVLWGNRHPRPVSAATHLFLRRQRIYGPEDMKGLEFVE
ncbi:MAG: hypothetical protein JSR77_12140, partial [Planctomycetes bacterium]|nr:hypothetical protein [Planctomycetota bacterium]